MLYVVPFLVLSVWFAVDPHASVWVFIARIDRIMNKV